MSPDIRDGWLKSHIVPAGIGLIALIALSLGSVSPPRMSGYLKQTIVDIGVERDKPLSLTMEVGVRDNIGVMDFFSETDETILLSVPSTWVRREVWNASINSVTSEVPSLGFTRWTLPSRAGISFKVPDAPDSLILHNPSNVQMKLNLVYVDLSKEYTERETVLIQGDTVKLW